MAGEAQAGAVPGRRRVFEVDEDAALAELERAWLMAAITAFASWSTACGARSAAPLRCSRAARQTGWTSRSGRTGRPCNER